MTSPLIQAHPVTVQAGPVVEQVCPRTGGPVLIYNADSANIAYAGYSKSIGTTNATPIQPLTFVIMDGGRTIYAFCPTASVTLNITPGGIQQSASPVQIATQIAASGIPSIDVPTALYINFNQTVAAGATFTSPNIPIGKFQSWFATMFCTATSSGLGTDPYTGFTMLWSVDTDNFDPLINHDWTVPNTPFNFVYNYRNNCQGPVFGNSVKLIWTNFDSQPVNITIGFFGSYRPRVRPKLLGLYHVNTGTGALDPTRGFGSDGIVTIYNPGGMPLAPGATAPTPDLLNLFDGPAIVSATAIYNAAGANSFEIVIQPQPTVLVGMSIPLIASGTTVAPATGSPPLILPPTKIMLPRRACTMTFTNNSNSANSINSAQVQVIAQHQPE